MVLICILIIFGKNHVTYNVTLVCAPFPKLSTYNWEIFKIVFENQLTLSSKNVSINCQIKDEFHNTLLP